MTTPVPLQHPGQLAQILGIPFSAQQTAAITAPLEPGVIIAGAGSGKTTVMAARVVWLIGTGQVAPGDVLGLTFTRKAAAELSQRISRALAQAGYDSTATDGAEQVVLTYDAFCARLVADFGVWIGEETQTRMVSQATRYRFAAEVVAEAAGPFPALSRLSPAAIAERVLELDAAMQSHLVRVDDLESQGHRFRTDLLAAPTWRGAPYADVAKALAVVDERTELLSLVRHYRVAKQRRGVREFADHTALAARIATEIPQVGQRLRSQYRIVLLDEFQDTSAAQVRVLAALFSGRTVADGLGHAVTAVGDPYQAIYGWRGAAANTMDGFSTTFRDRDQQPARRFSLTVNRRSGPAILRAANDVAARLRSQTHDVALLEAPDGARPATVEIISAGTWISELEAVATRIVAAHDAGMVTSWSDIAVLARRNCDIQDLYAVLGSHDVPVEIVGLTGLLGLPEIRDLVAMLQVVEGHDCDSAVVQLLTGSRWALGPADLAVLGSRVTELNAEVRCAAGLARSGVEPADLPAAIDSILDDFDPLARASLVDALHDPGPALPAAARDRVRQFVADLAYVSEARHEPLLDLAKRAIAALGSDVEVAISHGEARRRQLGAFLNLVANYAGEDPHASLTGLLAYLKAESRYDRGGEQAVVSAADSVKLLTVHKAKGLEWDTVFVPALTRKVFPSDQVRDNWTYNATAVPACLRGDADSYPQLTEVTKAGLDKYSQVMKSELELSEDRLAYVAFTRARNRLVLSYHEARSSGKQSNGPSCYLTTVMPQVPESARLLAHDVDEPEGAEAYPWPDTSDAELTVRRQQAAARVARACTDDALRAGIQQCLPPSVVTEVDDVDESEDAAAAAMSDAAAQLVHSWDRVIAVESAQIEERRSQSAHLVAPYLSVTGILTARRDPQAFRDDLRRPMPRKPSAAADIGTQFHEWVQHRFGQCPLDDTEPSRLDPHPELAILCRTFEAGPYADRHPWALEQPFTLRLGDQLIRGRIDAIYRQEDGSRYHIVDWKTGTRAGYDDLQLSLYRIALAELVRVPVADIDAVFYDVPRGIVVRPQTLVDEVELRHYLASMLAE